MKEKGCLMLFTSLALVFTTSNTHASILSNSDLDYYLDNECDMPECEVLPPAPPEEEQPNLELFDLLSRGSDFLANYTDVNEAIVLLGNTGSGKSTLAQIIAGNLTKLHSVLTSGCNLVIVDEDNKIGLPSTKSKTLFPELFFQPGSHPNSSSLPFYDYPGFDDTRGDVEDIAANFFMNQVTAKVINIKMLFLVIHSSVKFDERKDFDLLATHASTFVKNLDKYSDSFALIVTKVANFNSVGRYVEDRTIVAGIVEFLNKYIEDLQSKLDTITEDDELTRKKVLFVETLLQQDPATGNYSKIWFVRSPMECGPLSDQEMIPYTKNNITIIINLLNYTAVNTTVDFGFTLKSETKLTLANYTRSINTIISSTVQNLTEIMQKSYFVFENLVDVNSINFFDQNVTMYSKGSAMQSTLELIETTVTNSIELSNSMKLLWESLDYNLPSEFASFMRWQEEYLNFFDKATEQKQDRDLEKWIVSLQTFASSFYNHLDWYEFCQMLDSTVTSYEFQSKSDELPSRSTNMTWLEYIDQYVTPVSRPIKDVAEIISSKNVDLLNFLMASAFDETQIICDPTLKSAVVYGQFVQLKLHVNPATLTQKCGSISQIHVYAGHTIFFDDDLTTEDLDMVVIAPIWENSKQSITTIKLRGRASSFAYTSPAIRGVDCGGGGVRGTDGNPGRCGQPGSPGGTMFGIVDQIKLKQTNATISVTSVGGTGGKGQEGGNGGNSCIARDARLDSDPHEYYDGLGVCSLFPIIKLNRTWHYGFSGENGGKGGNGGMGGQGGLAGSVDVFRFEEPQIVVPVRQNGSMGQSGTGGLGGNGGETGRGYRWEPDCFGLDGRYYIIEASPLHGRVPGIKGVSGDIGASTLCSEVPNSPRPMVDRWIPILKYKMLYFNNTNPTTSSFLRRINANRTIQEHLSLQALAEESLMLGSLNRNSTPQLRLGETYTSLMKRLVEFHETNYNKLSNQHKKVLGMLSASANSVLISLDIYQNLDLNVDISYHLATIKMHVESLRTSTAVLAIQQIKQHFLLNLKQKVGQTLGFLEDVVTPAIHEAAKDIEIQLGILEEQLFSMIIDTKLSLEDCKEKLRKANEQQGIFNFLKVFDAITSIGTAFMPTTEFKTFDVMVKQLQGHFSGNPCDRERLKQLVEEAEKLVASLEDKRVMFENQFQPLINSVVIYFNNVSQSLNTGSVISSPQLDMKKWEVFDSLKGINKAIEIFLDNTMNIPHLNNAFDQLYNSMIMTTDLYEMIDQYLETQNLAGYMETVTSAILDPVPITDPELVHTVANFDLKLRENLLDSEVNKATHAFKQWVFPFAKFYFGGQTLQDHRPDHSAELGADHLRKVENLNVELEKYKTMSVGGQDDIIKLTNFSSGLKTSKPFFTWENEGWRTTIQDLMSGSTVNFYADVRQQGLFGWEAIKCKLIEINFKLNDAPEGMQDELDDVLDYFRVSVTHSGLSYYRFQQDYYIMTGANQTLMYNFERDSNGNRLGTNQVYEKFKSGDFLLSPYTLWTIKLFIVEPILKGKQLRGDVDFDSLKKFVPYMDVELVGMGIYVNGKEALDAVGGDLQLDMYYEKDGRMRIE